MTRVTFFLYRKRQYNFIKTNVQECSEDIYITIYDSVDLHVKKHGLADFLYIGMFGRFLYKDIRT